MSEYSDIELREVNPRFKLSMASVERLLGECGLKYEALDYMAALFDDDNNALACGGYAGSTVKCLAVSEKERGSGHLNTIISHLLQRLYSEGHDNVTIFTKPENEQMFVSLGFRLIARADKAIFMERGNGLEKYLKKLSEYKKDGKNGAVVMNCNPFTNGHRYLVEYASKQCDNLYLFVVSEDRSLFPSDVRFELVKKGVSDLENVCVIEGGKYIISNSTFPSYFLKEYSDVTKSHTQIDIGIFGQYISKALGITQRFVGQELTDAVTAEYNKTMEESLCGYGLEPLVVIPRKADGDGNIISASQVRKWIAKGDMESVKQCVPDTTYEYLTSDVAACVVERIKNEYK